MGSARTISGVGPRLCFIVEGDNSDNGVTVDNLIGSCTAARDGGGIYNVTHNLGNTAYAVSFTPEYTANDDVLCYLVDRDTHGFTCQCEAAGGGAVDPLFIHMVVHDSGG